MSIVSAPRVARTFSFPAASLAIALAGLASCGDGTKPDPNGGKKPAPQVLSIAPVENGSGIPLGALISGDFSTPMNPGTVTVAENFQLKVGSTAVTGTITYDEAAKKATFTPSQSLAASTTHTVTMSGMK
ncbi:MAG: Ig-like domain-containing protein, partial [Planctomycetota bacterium]